MFVNNGTGAQILSAPYWMCILGAALPWAIAVPVVWWVVSLQQSHGDSVAVAVVGALVALVVMVLIASIYAVYKPSEFSVDAFRSALTLSAKICVGLYGLIGVLSLLDVLAARFRSEK